MRHARADYQARIVDLQGVIPDDEPVMLFRAQDKHFYDLMLYYAERVAADPKSDKRVVTATMTHAKQALIWQGANPDKVKSPDLPD